MHGTALADGLPINLADVEEIHARPVGGNFFRQALLLFTDGRIKAADSLWIAPESVVAAVEKRGRCMLFR